MTEWSADYRKKLRHRNRRAESRTTIYYAILYCQAHVYHNNSIIQMKGAHLLKTVLTMAPDNVSLTR